MRVNKFILFSQILTATSFASLIGGSDDPQISIDGSGNALAIWEQRGDSFFSVQSVQYLTSEGWKVPNAVSKATANAFDPLAVTNSSDDTVAIFRQDAGGYTGIFAATSILGTDWSEPVQLSFAQSDFAKVGIDDSGNALVVWQQNHSSGNFFLASTHFIPGTGWSSPSALTGRSKVLMIPDMQTGKNGRSIAAWVIPTNEGPLFNTAIQAAFFSPTSGWSSPVFLSDLETGSFSPCAAVSDTNECLVAWQGETKTEGDQIMVAVLSAEGSWSEPSIISNSFSGVMNPNLAMNASGQAVVIWQNGNNKGSGASARVRNADGTWQPELIVSQQNAAMPEVALNDNGKAVAIWTQASYSGGLIAASVFEGGVWSEPHPLSSTDFASSNPEVRVNQDGTAFAVWQSIDYRNSEASVLASYLNLSGVWSDPVKIN